MAAWRRRERGGGDEGGTLVVGAGRPPGGKEERVDLLHTSSSSSSSVVVIVDGEEAQAVAATAGVGGGRGRGGGVGGGAEGEEGDGGGGGGDGDEEAAGAGGAAVHQPVLLRQMLPEGRSRYELQGGGTHMLLPVRKPHCLKRETRMLGQKLVHLPIPTSIGCWLASPLPMSQFSPSSGWLEGVITQPISVSPGAHCRWRYYW